MRNHESNADILAEIKASKILEEPIPQPQEDPKYNTICLADVEAQEVDWLWYPYIPLGKLTIIQGDPGCGKTFLTTALSSIVSNGWQFYGTDKSIEPGNVILQNGEDGLADTLKPRLQAAKANCNKVFIIDETEQSLSLQEVDKLKSIFEDIRPKLVVIDPIQQYLGRDVDFHRANEIRPVLAAIGRLAEEHKAAVIMVMHMSKATGSKAIYRSLGSIDLPAIARSILLVAENPDNPDERIMCHIKSSLARAGDSLAFTISFEHGIMFCGKSDMKADQLLNNQQSDNQEQSALSEAIEFIVSELSEGPKPADEMLKKSKKAGISERTLRRAKDELNVKSEKSTGIWCWMLKEKDLHELKHLKVIK